MCFVILICCFLLSSDMRHAVFALVTGVQTFSLPIFTPGALVQAGQAQSLATIQRTNTFYFDVTQSAAHILDLNEALRAGGLVRGTNDSAHVQLLLPNGKTYPLEGRLQFS